MPSASLTQPPDLSQSMVKRDTCSRMGAGVDIEDNDGKTARDLAAEAGNAKIAAMLEEPGG